MYAYIFIYSSDWHTTLTITLGRFQQNDDVFWDELLFVTFSYDLCYSLILSWKLLEFYIFYFYLILDLLPKTLYNKKMEKSLILFLCTMFFSRFIFPNLL